MNLPFFIAKRYVIAKKSHNVINIISVISMIGVAVGVMALVVVLSVFNGFDMLIRNLFSTFDADLKITLVEGKTFSADTSTFLQVKELKGVAVFSEVFEETAMFSYGSKQHIGRLKGVSDNYADLTGIDSMIVDGKFSLWLGSNPLAIMGRGVAYHLSASLAHFDPLTIDAPKRGASPIGLSAVNAFNRRALMPIGIFNVDMDYDQRYVIVPISLARELYGYTNEVTQIELKVNPDTDPNTIQQQVQSIVGSEFKVLNRYQQNESLYKTMRSEKLAISFILTLILVIASFNIIGSLSMLIIDKRKDVETLRNLGADNELIRKIFMAEGIIISFVGSVVGIILGIGICLAQIHFKLVTLTGTGTFIIDAYPVDIQLLDIAYVLVAVIVIGYISARFPVRYITNKILN